MVSLLTVSSSSDPVGKYFLWVYLFCKRKKENQLDGIRLVTISKQHYLVPSVDIEWLFYVEFALHEFSLVVDLKLNWMRC